LREHDKYVFKDYLLAKPKMTRDQAEWKWHHEQEAKEEQDYNPNGDKIDLDPATRKIIENR